LIKKEKKISAVFFSNLAIKTLYPDPDSLEMLFPDLDSMNSEQQQKRGGVVQISCLTFFVFINFTKYCKLFYFCKKI
jgi:hypothetical protein